MHIQFAESESFQSLAPQFRAWNLTPVYGEALYFKGEKYGHVALSISESDEQKDTVLWLDDWFPLPQDIMDELSPLITDTLLRFAAYIRGCRNENVSLAFEITDLSYRPTDYRHVAYALATARALMNCFAPELYPFEMERMERYRYKG